MEVRDEDQAAAYLKLQDDVNKLIVDTIQIELMKPSSLLHTYIVAPLLNSYAFKEKVKDVIKEQMNKY